MDPLLSLAVILALLADGSTATAATDRSCSRLGFSPTRIDVPLAPRARPDDVAASAAARDLDRLAAFMRQHDCRVRVDGYASPGGKNNARVSQRRADAVRAYLMEQGAAGGAVTASGKGVLEGGPLTNRQREIARVQP